MKQVVAHYGGKDFPDGATIPFYVFLDGEYKKVGEGVFDRKNSFITAQVDPETDDGRRLLENIFKSDISGVITKYHAINDGQNED